MSEGAGLYIWKKKEGKKKERKRIIYLEKKKAQPSAQTPTSIENLPFHKSVKRTAEISFNSQKIIISLGYLPSEAVLAQSSMVLMVLSWMVRFCRLGGFWNLHAATHRAK